VKTPKKQKASIAISRNGNNNCHLILLRVDLHQHRRRKNIYSNEQLTTPVHHNRVNVDSRIEKITFEMFI